MTQVTPIIDRDRRVYVSRSRQLLLSGSLIALYVVSLSLLFEPDPETGLKPLPSDYLWIIVPAGFLIVFLAWKALRTQIVTDPARVDLVRVVGHEAIGWRQLRRFEVHRTPGKQGYAVVVRMRDERVVKVWTEIAVRPVRDRPAAKALARERADALCRVLEADRIERTSTSHGVPDQPSRG